MNKGLSAIERLKSKKQIDALFSSGNSFAKYPIRVLWKTVPREHDFHAEVLFSVSKKKFKRAVDRNRVKRLLREAYRLNKHLLYEPFEKACVQVDIAFVFTANELPKWDEIQDKIILTLQRLVKEMDQFLNRTTV